MMSLQSYVLLCLTHHSTNKIANFICRNISDSFKLSALSVSNTWKNKTSDGNFKYRQLSANATSKTADATDRLTNNIPVDKDANDKSDNSKLNVFNNCKKINDIKSLERKIDEFDDALEDVDLKLPGPLDYCDRDLSYIGPNITGTYNFAKFADKCDTLQQLIKLGVKLYKLESNQEIMKMFLSLDFHKHMKPYIQFLHDCGVLPENLGNFITKNPYIFKQDMDNLYTRIRYLRVHCFTPEMIQRIVNKNPLWLSFNTNDIDFRLGYFQHTFALNGSELRLLTVRVPKLITRQMEQIKKSTFAVKEEMGFSNTEMREILLTSPYVWIFGRFKVVNSFDYAHNHMELSHEIISKQPQIMLCRKQRLQSRHEFLVHLKKNQYNPLKPLYISPLTLVSGTDAEFCNNVAKISLDMYNRFLKTM